MRIVERTTTKFVLSTGHNELGPVYGISGFGILVGACLFTMFAGELWQEWAAGMFRSDDWARVAGMIIISGLFIAFGILMLAGNPAQDCIFDKQSGTATIANRPIWSMFMPRIRRIPLQEISEIILYEGMARDLCAALVLVSGKKVTLTPAFKGKAGASEIAESMSEFLEIPLMICLGMEQILKVPSCFYSAERVIPLSCAKCGGRLPAVTRQMDRVLCGYCGTNMIVVWIRGAADGGGKS
jgi:hypothetical protein